MMANKPSALLLFLMTGLLLEGCDTPLNVKSPAASYFIKYFGNEGSQTGTDFIVNPDGTFVLFGTTKKGSGEARFFLVKADAKGNVMWEKTFGSAKCQARDIELASDGRIVVLGNMIVPGRADYDIYLSTFLDSTQQYIYFNGYKDAITKQPVNEDASAVTQTNDGFIVAGSSGNIAHSSDPSILRDDFILRVDANLAIYNPGIWPKIPSYGQGTENVATKIVQLPSQDFYVFGYTKFNKAGAPPYDFDFWYYGLGNNGNGPKSEIAYLGSPGKDQKLFSVSVDTTRLGNGFFLAGLETDPSGDRIYISRLHHPALAFDGAVSDALPIQPNFLGIDLGKLNTVSNPPNPSNEFVSVCALKNSGYLVLTNEVTTAGDNNLFLIKIKNDGSQDLAWNNTPIIYGGQGDDFAGSVQELPDGKIAIIGTITVGQASVNNGETKMVLIKVNQGGQFAD